MAGGASILIIDDDEDYRASLRGLLEDAGYAVREAADGVAGLTMLGADRPDLIVLDVMMAYLSEGYSIIQALRCAPEYAAAREVPVIMASSIEADPEALYGWVADTRAIAPDEYLVKPLDPERFLATVRRLLER
jgi:CheY-like chemotaxis protein